MKTITTLALLAVAATALVPSVAADTFIVTVTAGGETVGVQQSVPADACEHYRYQTRDLPVHSYGGGNGETCTSHTTV